ncbi:MAG: hypothetical protein ACEQSA_01135 [Weeksellaceae bacterium]
MAEVLQLTGTYKDRVDQLPIEVTSKTRWLESVTEKMGRFRDHYIGLPPNDQASLAIESMNRLLRPSVAEQLVMYHFGDSDPSIHDEDLVGMSPQAVERITRSFETRSRRLWPFLLIDPEAKLQPATSFPNDHYLPRFYDVTEKLGLYPFYGSVDTIPNQRVLDHHVRRNAANIMFVRYLQTMPSIDAATSPVLAYMAEIQSRYANVEPETLQQALLLKMATTEDSGKVQQLADEGLWDNKEALIAMSLDRGLREHIIDFYGIYRSVSLRAPISGYSEGQKTLALNASFRNILRVTD